MKVYCRDCGGLLAEDVDLMSTIQFKKRYGDVCPHCKCPFSNQFSVHEIEEDQS